MCVNFLKLTVSTYAGKINGLYKIPLFQFVSSFASDPITEIQKYEDVKKIVKNYSKIDASNLLKGFSKTCFATNSFHNTKENMTVTNLDVSLLLILINENRFLHNTITINQVNNKYSFDRPEYRLQIAKLCNLKFSIYRFAERDFYENLPVFDYLFQKGDLIEFRFSEKFKDFIFAGGKTIKVPISALTSTRGESNAIYTLGQIYISSISKVQNYFQNPNAGKMSVEFSLRDLLEFCGLNFKLIKFHKLAEFTYDMIHDFARINSIEEDEDFSVNSIIIKKYDELMEFPDNSKYFINLFSRKNELIDSIIEITFNQRDPYL